MTRLTAVPNGPRVGENAQPVGPGVKRANVPILTGSGTDLYQSVKS